MFKIACLYTFVPDLYSGLFFLIYFAFVMFCFLFFFTVNLTAFGTANQSSLYGGKNYAVNAINPPISNKFDLTKCTHTKDTNINNTVFAWWMFNISFGAAYITDILIYYREACK